ncbi:MAG: glutaredoxin [Thermoprotei archaeon]|nr:MAG: glutaredoxin [Thermoprotei archaeon]
MVIKIDDETKKMIKEIFKKLRNDVKIYHFRPVEKECRYCDDTIGLLKTLSNLSGNRIRVVELTEKSPEAEKYNIDKFQAILLHGVEEYNIRFFGIPVGYEFGALIEDIVDVSLGRVELPPDIINKVKSIKKSVDIKVFVTPTCPYCPLAVRAAHKYAILNLNITSSMVECIEFPKLAEKYNVYAVPKIVINDKVEFEGVVPDKIFIEYILKAIK